MRAITVNSANCLQITNQYPIPIINSQDLLIEIKATAVNRADILQKKGKYPPPKGESEILGLEAAGIIAQVGKDAEKNGWKKGERVAVLLASGGYAQFCKVHHQHAFRIPSNLSFIEGACIPEAFITAYQALYCLANLNVNTNEQNLIDKKKILIHAGASGVGSALIQLAKNDYQIYITTGSQEKIDACKLIGANFAINYKEKNFVTEILNQTNNQGVDILIDFVGATYWQQNLQVLSIDGTMVMLGFLGGNKIPNDSNIAPIVQKRLKIVGSTLRSRDKNYKSNLVEQFVENKLHLFEKNILKPIIHSVFNWQDVEQAHNLLESNKTFGKIGLLVD
eukprot:TRINITY_DN4533_c1_g1_i1.p1 TRINITY_DN4533_c1_g1~~TRINITY_DN4533_c1_g1_i1.p1  ORF type:complete len:337 (-),score=154.30 TRINITY_DN4533_c1_g1_i1:82-1092(-)